MERPDNLLNLKITITMDQLPIHGNHRGDLNHPHFSLALWGGGRGSLDLQHRDSRWDRCQSGYYNNKTLYTKFQ